MTNRRKFLRVGATACSGLALLGRYSLGAQHKRTIRVALVQFDAVPEQVEANLAKMKRLSTAAADAGARWILFHEGTVADYVGDVGRYAEPVPSGPSTQFMMRIAAARRCYIAFGLSEVDKQRHFITHVFVGPRGLVHRYRKTWIWHARSDDGFRNEWVRYDPGTGPELFELDGIKATCFICADGEAPRCVERARHLRPQVVIYPNNRRELPEFEVFGQRAKEIGAPMLVTNRIGQSWLINCKGGNVVYSAGGEMLAKANREGREEILIHDLVL